ncbi:hypothetical protein [Xanthomonas oryzae]|uniref:hypothetical protein n=1 Tax=Xanthomonas oryzae TaxID=347 RepID=UPI001F52AB31|nr:hypothetical protein [Xanthomonas oryzae]
MAKIARFAARCAVADACDWQTVDVGLSGTGDHLATTTGRISDHDPHPAHDITPLPITVLHLQAATSRPRAPSARASRPAPHCDAYA